LPAGDSVFNSGEKALNCMAVRLDIYCLVLVACPSELFI
jgi:hypothetical protein